MEAQVQARVAQAMQQHNTASPLSSEVIKRLLADDHASHREEQELNKSGTAPETKQGRRSNSLAAGLEVVAPQLGANEKQALVTF
jgi:hypothetical protein